MDKASYSPALLGQETPGSRVQTQAVLTLALLCEACLGVASVPDGTRARRGCPHCGAAFANWAETVVLHASLDAVVQHAWQEAMTQAAGPQAVVTQTAVLGCGHPPEAVASSDEGTAYCMQCAAEAREGQA